MSSDPPQSHNDKDASPRITQLKWGSIEVDHHGDDGKTRCYRDAKLFPGGSCDWDWRVNGTGHLAGIQVGDLDDLVKANPDEVILTKGKLSCLKVPQATVDALKERLGSNVKVHVESTGTAYEHYNRLVDEGVRVAGLFHTTC